MQTHRCHHLSCDFLFKTLNICVSLDWVQPRDEASLLCERDHAQPEQQEPAVRHWHTHATDASHDFHSKSPKCTCVFSGPKLWFWSCWQRSAWWGGAMTSFYRHSTTSKRFLLAFGDLQSDHVMELLPVLLQNCSNWIWKRCRQSSSGLRLHRSH